MGDVVAPATVTTSDRLGQQSVFIDEGQRHAINFVFKGVLGRFVEITPYPAVEVANANEIEDVFDRQHRGLMGDGDESVDGRAADAMRGAIGIIKFGMGGFKFAQPGHELIELAIGDFRSGIDIVEAVVMVDLVTQTIDFMSWIFRGESGFWHRGTCFRKWPERGKILARGSHGRTHCRGVPSDARLSE